MTKVVKAYLVKAHLVKAHLFYYGGDKRKEIKPKIQSMEQALKDSATAFLSSNSITFLRIKFCVPHQCKQQGNQDDDKSLPRVGAMGHEDILLTAMIAFNSLRRSAGFQIQLTQSQGGQL